MALSRSAGMARTLMDRVNQRQESACGHDVQLLLEAMLFAAGRPVTVSELASVLDISQSEVTSHLLSLREVLRNRGIRLQNNGYEWRLVAAPEASTVIQRLLGLGMPPKLSSAAMEALAIIAYKQPITKGQIDLIRGVDSSGVINSLLTRGLIEEVGRAETPGRPILYGTTEMFLELFGLESLDQLPKLEDARHSIDKLISREDVVL